VCFTRRIATAIRDEKESQVKIHTVIVGAGAILALLAPIATAAPGKTIPHLATGHQKIARWKGNTAPGLASAIASRDQRRRGRGFRTSEPTSAPGPEMPAREVVLYPLAAG
jgi:hypothetical protein